jgi:hypothetical protein
MKAINQKESFPKHFISTSSIDSNMKNLIFTNEKDNTGNGWGRIYWKSSDRFVIA